MARRVMIEKSARRFHRRDDLDLDCLGLLRTAANLPAERVFRACYRHSHSPNHRSANLARRAARMPEAIGGQQYGPGTPGMTAYKTPE
jgi:hypothetical protein